MRMLDSEAKRSVRTLQLYVSPAEAANLRDALIRLLTDPEANEHEHVFCDHSAREMSLSIVTSAKLAARRYTALEQAILDEK